MRLLLADRAGTLEETVYPALGRSGRDVVPLSGMIPLPRGAQLVQMPDRCAVTRDAAGDLVRLPADRVPVAALLPVGYTRTLLPPAFGQPGQVPLPLFGYTAVAEHRGELYVAATRTDAAPTWDTRAFNTPDLRPRVERTLARLPGSVVAEQLARCALEYGCYTAQNTFYERWEMALPTSVACNARCVGCLSEQEEHSCPASQARITRRASPDDVVALALPHLQRTERPMVSFGQGCEGEPLLNWRLIEEVIRRLREETARGWINLNTNASDPEALARLLDAGLDSIRVSTFSARPETYAAYYRPRTYTFADVERSLQLACDRGIRTAVNLLLFPGVTDRASEAEALARLFRRTKVEQVQLRNLNVDPDQLMESLPPDDSPAMGVPAFIDLLRAELPDLQIGSVSRLPRPDAMDAALARRRRPRPRPREGRPAPPAGAGTRPGEPGIYPQPARSPHLSS